MNTKLLKRYRREAKKDIMVLFSTVHHGYYLALRSRLFSWNGQEWSPQYQCTKFYNSESELLNEYKEVLRSCILRRVREEKDKRKEMAKTRYINKLVQSLN